MLKFCDRLLRVNNRCISHASQARASTHRRRESSQLTKFNRRRDSNEKDSSPKKNFKSFGIDGAIFNATDPGEHEQFEFNDEDDYDGEILNAHHVYDEYTREESARKKAMVRNIIKKKYFKEPPEPTLLTWAAKQQLRYLHDTDPESWTPERLAESFPITVSGVKKFLANDHHRPLSENKIRAHDKAVYARWKQLHKDGGPILAALHHKFSSGNLDSANANLNTSLPVPDKELLMGPQRSVETSPRSDAPAGEFESMIVEYKRLTAKPESNTTELTLVPGQNAVTEWNEPSQVEEGISQDFLPRKGKKQVTFDHFKENMKRHLLKKSVDDPEPYHKFKKWFEDTDTSAVPPPPPPMEELLEDPIIELFEGKMNRLKKVDTPELKWDVHRDSKNPDGKEAYIYESKHGYQRPYGRYEDDNRIEIPESEWKEGAVYRRGNSYYDDAGELLYRVPFLTE